MDLESVTLRLSPDLLSGAQAVASSQDVTIGHVVRDLLRREIMRHARAEHPDTSKNRLVLALHTLLHRDLSEAFSWHDLIGRLAVQGFELAPDGLAVAVHRMDCGTRLCTTSELGVSHGAFARRFGAEMPGHPFGMDKILKGGCPEDTDTMTVIGGRSA